MLDRFIVSVKPLRMEVPDSAFFFSFFVCVNLTVEVLRIIFLQVANYYQCFFPLCVFFTDVCNEEYVIWRKTGGTVSRNIFLVIFYIDLNVYLLCMGHAGG
ncbi:hypothetical protein XENORESO_006965 [Xenotaenia resolanae]|uniref:Uncharacterized protein n=1 Tax=Xenotaenia resolanae TaxID=208358 RepID=A0ABV0W8Z0_9TELE